LLLSSLSRSWIDLLTSFVSLFESFLRSWIIYSLRLLNSLSDISRNPLSLESAFELL
jgi:hypothetical protein